MSFQAGQFDRKIYLMRPVIARSSTGQETVMYEDVGPIWANRKNETTGATEDDQSQRLTQIATVSWLIRYRTDVNEKWMVRDEFGVQHNIYAIAEMGRKMYMALKTRRPD